MSPRQTYSDPDHPGNHNPAMEEKWGAHLRSLGFRSGPAYAASPDGVYYCFADTGYESENDIQLIVIGPTTKTPFELACAVGGGFQVHKRGFLPAASASDEMNRMVAGRGFWVVWLRDPWAATSHQDSPEPDSPRPGKPELKVVGDGEA